MTSPKLFLSLAAATPVERGKSHSPPFNKILQEYQSLSQVYQVQHILFLFYSMSEHRSVPFPDLGESWRQLDSGNGGRVDSTWSFLQETDLSMATGRCSEGYGADLWILKVCVQQGGSKRG